jgi:hypothetical protein
MIRKSAHSHHIPITTRTDPRFFRGFSDTSLKLSTGQIQRHDTEQRRIRVASTGYQSRLNGVSESLELSKVLYN